MELFNTGHLESGMLIIVPVLFLIGALVLGSRVRDSHSKMALILSMMVIFLLSLQWALYDVAVATEPGVVSAETEWSVLGEPRFDVSRAVPSHVPENLHGLHSLVLAAFQILFAVAIPAVLTGLLLKRTRLYEQRVFAAIGNLRTLQTFLFVASSRQLCASPDAHGP